MTRDEMQLVLELVYALRSAREEAEQFQRLRLVTHARLAEQHEIIANQIIESLKARTL